MVTRDKILSGGVGTNSSLEGVHADAGNVVGCEAKMASAEGTLSGSSSKPYGVGTPVSASAREKSSSTCPKPSGVGAPLTVVLSGAISTIGVGTNATTAPLLPSSKPLGVDAPATSTPAPAGTQDGTYLAINMYRRQAGTALNLLGGAQCRSYDRIHLQRESGPAQAVPF